MSRITQEKIDELKAQYGALSLVEAPKGDIVFRKPSRGEYDRWFDKNNSDKAKATQHARELVKACRVFPDEQGLDAILDDCPSLTACECLNAITGMCGLQDSFAVKRL